MTTPIVTFKTIFMNIPRTAFFALFLAIYVINPKVITQEFDYIALHKTFPRLTIPIYEVIMRECSDQNIDVVVDMCAIAQQESNFTYNAIHYNTNGTIDSGLFQINSCLYPGDYKDLFDLKLNAKIAIAYYKDCLTKAKGDRKKAFRFYNAGQNSKENLYSNWPYVYAILENIERAKGNIKQQTLVEPIYY